MNSIQQATTGLEDTRRAVLYSLLKERYADDESVTEDFIKQEMQFYLESLEKGIPLLTPQPSGGLTDAGRINEEMQEAEIDIYTIFQQLNHVSSQIDQHQKLNESVLNDIKLKVRKMDEQLIAYNQQLVDLSAHAVIYETFLDSSTQERDLSFYTDRDGTPVASAYQTKLDVYKNAIKLPLTYSENTMVNFAGLKIADIAITRQLGSGFIRTRNPEYLIDKAVDTSMESFWTENILTDLPLEVNMGREYYGVDYGALCEFEVRFDSITRLNEITFTPFAEYPMEVLAIFAYTTDNSEEPGFELVSPLAEQKSQESTDTICYQFQDIVAKRLRVVLNQRHYVKRDTIIEIDEKSLTDAWLNSQGFIEIDSDKIFKPVYQDQFEKTPSWFYLNEFLKKRDVVTELMKYNKSSVTQKIQVSKYEYQYGLYNLAVNRNEYLATGIYVSQPMSHNNIHIAVLTAEEEHPLLNQSSIPVTGIEYYITDRIAPVAEDWIPIMPQNIDTIYAERLFVNYDNGKYKARTRFDVDRLLAVRRNGNRLRPAVDFELIGRTVIITTYDISSVYTVDYVPEENAYAVDFLDLHTNSDGKIITTAAVEQFTGLQKGNQIELTYVPFIDKEKLNAQPMGWNPTYLSSSYLPIKVRLILPDGQHINQPADKYDTDAIIVNKTDYYDSKINLLEPFTGENYQYRVLGDKIKFNTPLPDKTQVIVEYGYLTGPTRMKAIIRRNLHEMDGLTPFLHEYKFVFQSLT
jgi:hypothetical protein